MFFVLWGTVGAAWWLAVTSTKGVNPSDILLGLPFCLLFGPIFVVTHFIMRVK